MITFKVDFKRKKTIYLYEQFYYYETAVNFLLVVISYSY